MRFITTFHHVYYPILFVSLQTLYQLIDAQYTLEKVVATDGTAWDEFGTSVSIYNDFALVGARNDDDKGSSSGSAYIYERNNGEWSETKLVPDDGAQYDTFGHSVSIYNGYALVGAYQDDDKGTSSGSAYLYERTNGLWSQTVKLVADDGAAHDYFGYSVSIYNHYALIGAFQDDDKGTNSGSAYVFERTNGDWIQTAKLVPDDGAAGDIFGRSVSIYDKFALIGAPSDDAGSAYVFQRTDSGAWTQDAKLTADDGVTGDSFGISVSLYDQYALIGAYYDGSHTGSAYIYERINEEWVQTAKLVADDGATNDQFGWSVAVYNQYAVIGANFDDDKGSASGSAYIYERQQGIWRLIWTQTAKLVPDDGEIYGYFGGSVAISDEYVLVAASGDDNEGGTNAGAVYFAQIDNGYSEAWFTLCKGAVCEQATIAIGYLLVVLFIVNIAFMCCMKCNKRRVYTAVKSFDSSVDESSECDAINVV